MATDGIITQVIGSTFDARFSEESLPDIYNALHIQGHQHGLDIDLVGEVQQHLGGGQGARGGFRHHRRPEPWA